MRSPAAIHTSWLADPLDVGDEVVEGGLGTRAVHTSGGSVRWVSTSMTLMAVKQIGSHEFLLRSKLVLAQRPTGRVPMMRSAVSCARSSASVTSSSSSNSSLCWPKRRRRLGGPSGRCRSCGRGSAPAWRWDADGRVHDESSERSLVPVQLRLQVDLAWDRRAVARGAHRRRAT